MFDANYSFSERLLHRFALGSSFVAEASFDLERFISKQAQNVSHRSHLFIAGLARAGTTVLMRTFYKTGKYRSLTYRDMPFVLMPNIWRMLSSRFWKYSPEKERAHGDRILVNFDSPEALEEVFWRVHYGKDYIFDDCLKPHWIDNEGIKMIRQYIGLILSCSAQSGGLLYLSKNNNNVLRLESIRRAFPNSNILIPFRDPVQQAISMLAQHQKFCRIQTENKFSYHYMRWLAHHEFGLTHRPFFFEETGTKINSCNDATDINYWLKRWIEIYTYLLESSPSGSFFVCYESLCQQPETVLSSLFNQAQLDIDFGEIDMNFIASDWKEACTHVDAGLLNQASHIYQKLESRSVGVQ